MIVLLPRKHITSL